MSAQPSRYPSSRADPLVVIPHCHHCGRRLAKYVAEPWSIRCPKCGAQSSGGQIPAPGSFAALRGADAGSPTRGR